MKLMNATLENEGHNFPSTNTASQVLRRFFSRRTVPLGCFAGPSRFTMESKLVVLKKLPYADTKMIRRQDRTTLVAVGRVAALAVYPMSIQQYLRRSVLHICR